MLEQSLLLQIGKDKTLHWDLQDNVKLFEDKVHVSEVNAFNIVVTSQVEQSLNRWYPLLARTWTGSVLATLWRRTVFLLHRVGQHARLQPSVVWKFVKSSNLAEMRNHRRTKQIYTTPE